jgi:hypothetical protein
MQDAICEYGFNTLKVNGSTLIIEKMWKKSLIHSNINVGLKIITCILIDYDKCKMKLLNNGFNIEFNSSTMLIVEKKITNLLLCIV